MVHTLVEFYQLDFSSCTPLFDPEAFHTGNYTEITPQTKKPREEAI
jgi:hypothetical protein